MKIILASGSPRRKKLLEQIQLEFTVQASGAGEDYDSNDPPSDIVQYLALKKANRVAGGKQDVLVIGADTLVVFRDKILEKPAGVNEAVGMLKSLCGETHQVYTGVALVKVGGKGNIEAETTFFERTEVTFGTLDDDEILEYVKSGSPMDKAGGYGIQDDKGCLFIEKINGDYYNVVGFPLHSFYKNMKRFLLRNSARDPNVDS